MGEEELFKILIYGLFFVILFWAFFDTTEQMKKTENFIAKQEQSNYEYIPNSFYPIDSSAYYGYWGFVPYKGLSKNINPWWFYPYPYPTPINYLCDSCSNKL